VVAGIGVCDAAAAGRYALEPAFVERFEKDQKGAWLRHLLRLDQLLNRRGTGRRQCSPALA